MNLDFHQFFLSLLIKLPGLLFALTVHEFAHGFIAFRLGDPTAKDAGRLSLNPMHHLDPIGTLAIIFAPIGWAKPVPVNPVYFKNPAKDMMAVAWAGPASNILLLLASTALFYLCIALPISPNFKQIIVEILFWSMLININLAIFNCLPIPPLDGSKILMGLLPPSTAASYAQIEPYGIFILLALIFLHAFDYILTPFTKIILSILLPG